MRTQEEIRAKLAEFTEDIAEDPDDEITEAIGVTLAWVLGLSNQLDDYLAVR